MGIGYVFAAVRVLVVCLTCLWGVVLAQDESLDGSSFAGVMREVSADSGGDPDRIFFHDGRFYSEGCQKYGFKEAQYNTFQENGALHFEVATVSDSHGTMVWKGVRDGDRLEASVVWTKERWYWDTRREYHFAGHHVGQ